MNRLARKSWWLGALVAGILSACGGPGQDGTPSGGGMAGLAVSVTWPQQAASLDAATFRLPVTAPTAVTFMEFVLTGGTLTAPLTAGFAASAGTGTLQGIPPASGYTLTINGRASAGGAILYTGAKTGIDLSASANQTMPVTVAMAASGSAVPWSPGGVAAISPQIGKVTVIWDSVTGAQSYNVYATDGTNLISKFGVTSPFTQTMPSSTTLYSFGVTAVNSAGEGPPRMS